MPQPTFIHLRVHSAFSLSEGALQIKKLASLCKDAKMPALAITDTNNLFGALEFSDALSDKGIQPIVGIAIKVDLTPADQAANKFQQPTGLKRFASLALLAQNEQGYLNLIKLSSTAFLDVADNAEPHVSLAKLEACSAGLICLSGGPGGPINEALVLGQKPAAEALTLRLKTLFEDRFYIELQRHETSVEKSAEPGLIELAYAHEIPLVATNQ